MSLSFENNELDLDHLAVDWSSFGGIIIDFGLRFEDKHRIFINIQWKTFSQIFAISQTNTLRALFDAFCAAANVHEVTKLRGMLYFEGCQTTAQWYMSNLDITRCRFIIGDRELNLALTIETFNFSDGSRIRIYKNFGRLF